MYSIRSLKFSVSLHTLHVNNLQLAIDWCPNSNSSSFEVTVSSLPPFPHKQQICPVKDVFHCIEWHMCDNHFKIITNYNQLTTETMQILFIQDWQNYNFSWEKWHYHLQANEITRMHITHRCTYVNIVNRDLMGMLNICLMRIVWLLPNWKDTG